MFTFNRIKKDEGQGQEDVIKTMMRTNERLKYFYYEQQIKRELKGIHTCGCRWNERLKTKTDGSKRLRYTGLCGELEDLTIETRLIDESFEFVTDLTLDL